MRCNCGETHDVKRDKNVPEKATGMWCNWCPSCEDTASEDYNEGYVTGGILTTPDWVNPNQRTIFDELNEKEKCVDT